MLKSRLKCLIVGLIFLSAVAGFSAALIKFAGDLPDQSILIQDSLPCYSCSVLKILSLLVFYKKGVEKIQL